MVVMETVPTFLLAAILSSALGQPPLLPSEESLTQEAIFISEIVNNHIHQALFPEIHFACAGNLTRWTIVAVPVGGGSRYPQLQIWRRQTANTFTRSERVNLNSNSPNPTNWVYEAHPDPPLSFEAGDVFGLYNPPVPRLSLRYQERGGPQNHYIDAIANPTTEFNLGTTLVQENRNDYPLVAVDVSPPECAVGFIDREALLRKSRLLSGSSSNLEYGAGTQRIIPELAFSENGTIVNITMGALRLLGGELPEIQLWRSTGENQWVKVQSISNTANITYNIALNVHRYTPQTPIPVQAGDIVGFYQPFSSRLRVYMQESSPLNYYKRNQFSPLNTISTDDARTERRLPLITVQFNPTHTTTPTEDPTHTTPTKAPSTRTAASTNAPAEFNPTGVIVGVVIAPTLGGLSIMGVALLVLWRCRMRRLGDWMVRREEERCVHGYDTTVQIGHRHLPSVSGGRGSREEAAAAQQNVVINGENQPVDLKQNSAYEGPEGPKLVSASNPLTMDHQYEDVSIEDA